MSDFYFKKSKSRGKEYMQVWYKNKFCCSLGSAEKAYHNSVRLKELEEQTEQYKKILTEINKVKN